MSFLDDLLPKYDVKEAKKNKREMLISEMEIFDNLPEEDRSRINYAEAPMTPSLFKKGFYAQTSVANRSFDQYSSGFQELLY